MENDLKPVPLNDPSFDPYPLLAKASAALADLEAVEDLVKDYLERHPEYVRPEIAEEVVFAALGGLNQARFLILTELGSHLTELGCAPFAEALR